MFFIIDFYKLCANMFININFKFNYLFWLKRIIVFLNLLRFFISFLFCVLLWTRNLTCLLVNWLFWILYFKDIAWVWWYTPYMRFHLFTIDYRISFFSLCLTMNILTWAHYHYIFIIIRFFQLFLNWYITFKFKWQITIIIHFLFL